MGGAQSPLCGCEELLSYSGVAGPAAERGENQSAAPCLGNGALEEDFSDTTVHQRGVEKETGLKNPDGVAFFPKSPHLFLGCLLRCVRASQRTI